MPDEPNTWNATEDLRSPAAELIRDHHKHLVQARIEYLWKRKASITGGRLTLGTAKLATEKDVALAGKTIHFVITVAADFWKRATDEERAALLDHELSHCGFDAQGAPILYPHDAEEFASILRRHGVWRKDLQPLVDAAKQLPLPFERELTETLASLGGAEVTVSMAPGVVETFEREAKRLEMVT